MFISKHNSGQVPKHLEGLAVGQYDSDKRSFLLRTYRSLLETLILFKKIVSESVINKGYVIASYWKLSQEHLETTKS
jgi:hypothetical protein